ncbi:TPA: glycosyltransferase [Salmonella bongori]|nr:glycosyltransferase [Salmonella bongori]
MISVVMCINKYDLYVLPAINSILSQTYKNFELIIVVNGNDAKIISNILKENLPTDQDIRIIETCIGQLGFSLNLAISLSKYDIIARMDSDDISLPERLARQLIYLEKNNLDIVGSAINLIDENNILLDTRTYPNKTSIANKIIFKNCFAHPSVMFRKSFFLKFRGYNGGFNSEDYDLWLRMRDSTPRWDNMDEPLLNYRIHSNSTQKSKLAYYECASYSLREFLKNRKIINFIACIYHFSKALIK